MLINNDIRVFKLGVVPGSNDEFCFYKHPQFKHGVAKWKQIFAGLDALPDNPKIGLMLELNFEYFCIFFAGMEIGANFVILDGRFDEKSSHRLFLPLDLLVYDDDTMDIMCDDINYWRQNAQHLISATQVSETLPSDILTTDHVLDIKDDLRPLMLMSSTTSGSTGSLKPVSHSYGFILDLAKRNAKVLNLTGRAAHIKNLYHGSSLPVFYLPSLIGCNFHYCAPAPDLKSTEVIDMYVKTNLTWTEHLDINHILFPYPYVLEAFLKAVTSYNMIFTDLKIYTLSYINPDYKKYIKGRNIEIISIFGCTETSGPIMINKLSNQNANNFDPKIYHMLDDFYSVTILDDGTQIKSRDGVIDHVMEDRFEQIDHRTYRHLGRSNLYRINDVVIPFSVLENISSKLEINGQIVVDMITQTLYLAVWNKEDCKKLQDQVNKELIAMLQTDLVQITDADNLDQLNFISGIKVNQELIRNYFRSRQ